MQEQHSDENSGRTATRRMPEGRRFPKGRSANPGGRPISFASYVREQTQNGKEIVDTALGIMRNKKASDRLRLQAAEFLSDRAWGRVEQTTVIRSQEDATEFARLVDDAASELFGEDGRQKLEDAVRARFVAEAA